MSLERAVAKGSRARPGKDGVGATELGRGQCTCDNNNNNGAHAARQSAGGRADGRAGRRGEERRGEERRGEERRGEERRGWGGGRARRVRKGPAPGEAIAAAFPEGAIPDERGLVFRPRGGCESRRTARPRRPLAAARSDLGSDLDVT